MWYVFVKLYNIVKLINKTFILHVLEMKQIFFDNFKLPIVFLKKIIFIL